MFEYTPILYLSILSELFGIYSVYYISINRATSFPYLNFFEHINSTIKLY